jgi:hypothetical protein
MSRVKCRSLLQTWAVSRCGTNAVTRIQRLVCFSHCRQVRGLLQGPCSFRSSLGTLFLSDFHPGLPLPSSLCLDQAVKDVSAERSAATCSSGRRDRVLTAKAGRAAMLLPYCCTVAVGELVSIVGPISRLNRLTVQPGPLVGWHMSTYSDDTRVVTRNAAISRLADTHLRGHCQLQCQRQSEQLRYLSR